ncbi:hypothetical protein [Pseudomonas sp. KCJK9016]|uniref:hypothetical protein n=1 Tax=Pseudomonas sp. KCJK9016 TaxID=3344556 RepID=UPI003905D8B4
MVSSMSECSFLRILVADDQFEQCVLIEKSLSLLGYFRVCPVNTFHELTLLSHFSPNTYERFDLLIVNAKLITSAGLDVAKFCVNNSRFRHVLVYGGEYSQAKPQNLSVKPHHQVRRLGSLTHQSLVEFLSVIDTDFIKRRTRTLSDKVA